MIKILEKLKYKPDIINKKISVKNGKVTVNEKLYIVFPDRFVSSELCILSNVVSLTNIFIIMDENGNYAKSFAPIMSNYSPTVIHRFNYLNKPQIALEFEKDSVMVVNTNSVEDESIIGIVLDEFIVKGHTPWYLSYTDTINVFVTAREYGGGDMGDNIIPLSVIISLTARDRNNMKIPYRNILNSLEDLKKPHGVLSLSDIYEGYNNTMAKITGNYLQKGIDSAIVDEDKLVTPIESVIRD